MTGNNVLRTDTKAPASGVSTKELFVALMGGISNEALADLGGGTDGWPTPLSTDRKGRLILAPGSVAGGTQYTAGATQATPTGTVALGKDSSNVVKALPLDASGNLVTSSIAHGGVAAAGTSTDNPVIAGGVVTTGATDYPAYVAGKVAYTVHDPMGRQVVAVDGPPAALFNTCSPLITASTEQTLQGAPGLSGLYWLLRTINVSNSDTGVVTIVFKNGSGGTIFARATFNGPGTTTLDFGSGIVMSNNAGIFMIKEAGTLVTGYSAQANVTGIKQ